MAMSPEKTRVPTSIKLTITGASGVGKTTLAKRLAQSLGIAVIPELARDLCVELGYKKIGEIPDQEGFKRLVFKKQIEVESGMNSFVADRSTIDCWVLWQRWNICPAMTYDTEALYEACLEHAQTYTHIIYVPPLFQPEDDGFRWTEPDYIKQIDRITRMTLYDFQLWPKVHTVSSSDLALRHEMALDWIKSGGLEP